jgi:hypothetical protein
MIKISIDSIDRSSIIEFNSVEKNDVLNNQTDFLSFEIIFRPGQSFKPEVNSEVAMLDGAVKVFGGKIYSVDKTNNGDGSAIFSVKAKDFSYDFDRYLVNEAYNDETVDDIIADIVSNYASDFTVANVDCDLVVDKISFSRMKGTDCLRKLADITGYSFYIDYEKDIHFFEKNTEPAPISISDTSGNFLNDTLTLSDDISQIRNRVYFKGGEIEGDSRTETFNGDGVKKQFKLANKFAHKPTVLVGGTAVLVGIDYLDDEASFDCFWDFNQQYLRFKDTTIPASGTNNISVSGTFLFNLIIQVSEPVSISKFGVFEFSKTDLSISSRDTALQSARAELEAYKNGVVEGEFETYESGLRSGQIISVNSVILGVAENFLIQRVDFRMITQTIGIWKISLASLRTVGIIDFLLSLLKTNKILGEGAEATLEKTEFPLEQINISEVVGINSNLELVPEVVEFGVAEVVQDLDYPTEFCYGDFAPTGYKRCFLIEGSPLS